MKQRVYLAGGFKSNWQSIVIEALSDRFVFFNPREHGLDNSDQYSPWDIHFVKSCDILFGYMEESNPSGYGLAFEIGLAAGLNKTIILVDDKSLSDNLFASRYNLVRHPATVFTDLKSGIEFLKAFSQHLR